MNVKIFPHKLEGTIDAMPSKSQAHRILIAQKLAKLQGCQDVKNLKIPAFSEDIKATKSCLYQMDKDMPYMQCGESGSTLRFLLPVTMALKDRAEFLGTGRLPHRPISPLKEEMERHGCSFVMGSNKNTYRFKQICTVSGRLTPGDYCLPGNISSQFITGLLFALPLLEGDSTITLTTALESAGYVDMTLEVLEQFGIIVYIEETEKGFPLYGIPGNQIYNEPVDLRLDGDWSNAAFWLACGLLGGEITVRGLNLNSKQRDKEIINIMAHMGAHVDLFPQDDETCNITASFSELQGIEKDISQIPDLTPVLAVLMSTARGTSMITHAERLKLKESNRIRTICYALCNLGADVSYGGDRLSFTGKMPLKGGNIFSYGDHRIAMAAAIASSICINPVIIAGADAVNKSYPEFFHDFMNLSGKVVEL